tara:strand:+ start:733 stop:1023 length:291 start_codon:yes stop_codon:yes gene_type:complete
MKFKIKEEEGFVYVNVTLPKYNGKNYQNCRTGTVMEHLKKKKVSFGDVVLHNSIGNEHGPLEAEWIFIKTVDKPTPSVVSSNRAKRTKKSPKPKDE